MEAVSNGVWEGVLSYLNQVPGAQGEALRALFLQEHDTIRFAPGSSGAHHAYRGGFIVHLEEMLELGTMLRHLGARVADPDFTESDLIVAIVVHDIEKPWRYGGVSPWPEAFGGKAERAAFRRKLCDLYTLKLTPQQWNAVEYAEGEFEYEAGKTKMGPLAAVVHAADVMSARWLGVTV